MLPANIMPSASSDDGCSGDGDGGNYSSSGVDGGSGADADASDGGGFNPRPPRTSSVVIAHYASIA
uniref:Uncharacterized protein n=1 Tax=Oryza brachyantha TaxID=4533 RepID=J3M779_ORYBR